MSEKTSIKYMELLGFIEVNLKYKGWSGGLLLLSHMTVDAESHSVRKFMFEKWLNTKSTLDIRAAADGYQHLFQRELDFINAVDSLDSCIL